MKTEDEWFEIRKATQLETFKAGARWAAAQEIETYPTFEQWYFESIYDDGARDLSKKILKELEKLTEIPK